ncbi:hypothetical protein ACOBR2_20995 (plasmid) [Telmatobacter bradus]|uniref:hypothetical protein n=1 Tax=Telmatobacter bradus TaxID=474953 RepID=UPI003B42AEBF
MEDIDEPVPVIPVIPMEVAPNDDAPMEDASMDPEESAELPSVEPVESMELPSIESEDWPWAQSAEDAIKKPSTKGTSRRIRIILFSCTRMWCNKLFVKK